MRNNRLKNIESVYLLGAGASYAMTLSPRGKPTLKTTPLDSNFNERILKHRSNKRWVKEAIELHKKNWVGAEKLENLRLEESILKRSGNYDLLNSIHNVKLTGNRWAPSKCENDLYINNLSHLITEILYNCKKSSNDLTDIFAKGLFKKKQITKSGQRRYILPTRRVITFNYDTILDEEILRLGHIDETSMYFDRIGGDQIKAKDFLQRKPRSEPFPFLVKLHGSANWRVSEDDYKDIINSQSNAEDRVSIWHDWENIPSVSQNISPLIVPPLPNKPITKCSIFAHLWQCAFEYLHEAKRLVIAGYSCPQTDSFAMSLLSNIKDSKFKEIIIIDPNVDSLSKYKSLLKGAIRTDTKWIYYDDFGEYISQTYG